MFIIGGDNKERGTFPRAGGIMRYTWAGGIALNMRRAIRLALQPDAGRWRWAVLKAGWGAGDWQSRVGLDPDAKVVVGYCAGPVC